MQNTMSVPLTRTAKRLRKTDWRFYIMLLPPAVFLLIFNYIPIYGLIMAFQDYNPALGIAKSSFVGWKWFQVFFTMPDCKTIIWNTLSISLMKIILGQSFSLLFALLLNEIHNRLYKRTVQTITYFPHFLSWVIIGTIFVDMLSTKGLVNNALGQLSIRPIFFLGSNHWFQPTMVILETWKEFGWGAIMYLAAITTINPEYYEAATIDGAGRLRQIWYITLPCIKSIVLMLLVLAMGGVLNAGFEQILVMYNPAVYSTGDIIDTFIYRQGLLNAQFSMSTAIGLFKSVIGMVLMLITNYLAVKYSDYRIF